MSTGILTTAILLIVGYVVITRLIGLAFRLVVPVVLLLVLGGAGLFSGLMPERGPSDLRETYGYERQAPSDGRRLGDLRLRDIADGAVDTARFLLERTLTFLDHSADARPPEGRFPPYSRQDHAPRDRFGAGSFDDEAQWDEPQPRRGY